MNIFPVSNHRINIKKFCAVNNTENDYNTKNQTSLYKNQNKIIYSYPSTSFFGLINFKGNTNPQSIDFESTVDPSKYEQYYQYFAYSKGYVTREDFERFKEFVNQNPAFINFAKNKLGQPPCITTKPEELAVVSKEVSEHLNKKYGENNYRIISIGRSPAAIAQQLYLTGHDVVFFPISGIDQWYSAEALNKFPGLKYIKGILEKANLNDGKKNILTDYIIYGETISYVDEFIRGNFPELAGSIEHLNISNNENRLAIGSETLVSCCSTPKAKKMANKLSNDIAFGEGSISPIPMFKVLKFPEDNQALKNEIQKIENYSNPGARMYAFISAWEGLQIKK